jgi:hypothetical protein
MSLWLTRSGAERGYQRLHRQPLRIEQIRPSVLRDRQVARSLTHPGAARSLLNQPNSR